MECIAIEKAAYELLVKEVMNLRSEIRELKNKVSLTPEK